MKAILLSVCAMFLASCSTIFGVSQSELDTANKNLAAYTIQITSAAQLTTSLLRSGAISPDQAEIVHTGLTTALDTVQTAKDAIAANGDPSQAENALDAATSAVGLALQLLSGFTGEQVSTLRKELNNGSETYCGSGGVGLERCVARFNVAESARRFSRQIAGPVANSA